MSFDLNSASAAKAPVYGSGSDTSSNSSSSSSLASYSSSSSARSSNSGSGRSHSRIQRLGDATSSSRYTPAAQAAATSSTHARLKTRDHSTSFKFEDLTKPVGDAVKPKKNDIYYDDDKETEDTSGAKMKLVMGMGFFSTACLIVGLVAVFFIPPVGAPLIAIGGVGLIGTVHMLGVNLDEGFEKAKQSREASTNKKYQEAKTEKLKRENKLAEEKAERERSAAARQETHESAARVAKPKHKHRPHIRDSRPDESSSDSDRSEPSVHFPPSDWKGKGPKIRD